MMSDLLRGLFFNGILIMALIMGDGGIGHPLYRLIHAGRRFADDPVTTPGPAT
jgi:hypothetical protein